MHQVFPLVCRKGTASPHLVCCQVCITHPAVKIAEWGQFELPVDRNTLLPGFLFQIIGEIVKSIFLFSGTLSETIQKFQSVSGIIQTASPLLSYQKMYL